MEVACKNLFKCIGKYSTEVLEKLDDFAVKRQFRLAWEELGGLRRQAAHAHAPQCDRMTHNSH